MVGKDPDNRANDTADARIDNRKSIQPGGNEHTPEVIGSSGESTVDRTMAKNVPNQRLGHIGAIIGIAGLIIGIVGLIIGIAAISLTVYGDIDELRFEILKLEATNEILRSENRKLWPLRTESEPTDMEPIEPVATPKLEIEMKFTDVPSKGGGPSARGDIGGRIDNLPEPQHYKIVLYALTNHWYVQPTEDQFFTDIDAKGQWSNWTHLGSSYAALLVLPPYKPDLVTEELPRIGGRVLSKVTAPAN